MKDDTHQFRVRTGTFEFEVSGDKTFVEKMVKQYQPTITAQFDGQPPAAAETAAEQDDETSAVSAASGRTRRGRRGGRGRGRTTANDSAGTSNGDEADEAKASPKQAKTSAPARGRRPTRARSRMERADDDERHRHPSILSDNVRTPLQDFFANKTAATHQERVLLLGYFLQVMEGRDKFTEGELKEAYQAIDAEQPENFKDTLTGGIRTGLFAKDISARTARFSLTLKGRQYIENELILAPHTEVGMENPPVAPEDIEETATEAQATPAEDNDDADSQSATQDADEPPVASDVADDAPPLITPTEA